MCRKRIERGFILAVLLISLISISSAAGPTAKPDLYQAQCGVVLSVPAPGLLANDLPSGKITVSTFTAPSAGTLTVDPSGSFVYTPPQNSIPGGYATFYYKETDGTSVSNQVMVKIAVSCQCKGAAPNVDVCPGTTITPDFLMSKGAGCIGCKDATPKFDLSKIPAQPVTGQCYPYTVACPSCNVVTGQVCFRGPCTITSVPFTVCSSVTPTTAQIKDSGKVKCSGCGDTDPAISDPIRVGNHWEYTITCQSLCGPATATGTVNIDASCVPTIEFAFPIPTDNCQSHVLPTSDYIKENGGVSCGCGGTLVIPEEDIHWINTPPEANEWVGEYTAICRSANGCEASAVGQFTSASCEVDKCINVVCDDKNPCTDDSCDPATGCVNTANTAKCDDDNACTTGDVCADKVCTPGTAVSCEDNNVCTTDNCDPASGCVHDANTASCSDGNACTTGDVCADKVCTPGTAVSCEDNNVCTTDSCDSVKGCQNTDNTAKCDDGVACTTGDVCSNGACAGTPDNSKCSDGNVCTNDVCTAGEGCSNPDNTAKCDDGVACTTGDICSNGACAGTPDNSKCSDGNVCTNDVCTAGEGCQYTDNTATCNDGLACTTNDKCSAGTCAGTPDNSKCCDNNVCTNDVCTAGVGCEYTDNTAKCDDRIACTTGDVCSGGTCAGTPDDSKCCDGIACTEDVCDQDAGCQHTPDDSKCPSDGNECTEDVCNPSAGCVHTNEPTGTDCTYSGLCVDKATCQKAGSVAYCTPSSGAKNLCQDLGYPNNYKCCAASNTCTSNCGNACISHNQCTT